MKLSNGVHESIALLLEEGLPNVSARHARHAEATGGVPHREEEGVLAAMRILSASAYSVDARHG